MRAALDLVLRAWRLPPGEALVSAVNIPGMFAVLRAHGLTPVAVAQDAATLALDPAACERASSPRTRLVLVAHLFGGRAELEPLLSWAAGRGLPVIEDCAQAYAGAAWSGNDGATASLFSFGTIKTATALGGAVAHIRDVSLLTECRTMLAQDQRPAPGERLRRIALGAALKLATSPCIYGLLVRSLHRRGIDLDGWLRQRLRGYPDDDVARLRVQPDAGLRRTLCRRLHEEAAPRLARRCRQARRTLYALPATCTVPGASAAQHVWWCLPVVAADPELAVASLRRAGIDATRRGSALVGPPASNRGGLDEELLRSLVFVPVLGLGRRARHTVTTALSGGTQAPAQ